MPNTETEKSCGCILIRGEEPNYEVLLIQNLKGSHWSFPKGHMEAGETEKETAEREVREEVGYTPDFVPDFRTASKYLGRNKNQREIVYFLARVKCGELCLQREEVSDYAWFRLNEAALKLTFERDIRMLKDASRFLFAKH